MAVWSPDCEWHPFLTARVEGDPGYHGHNGMRAWFEDVDEMFSEMHVELGRFRQVGDRLLVLGQMTATGRVSGAVVSSEVAWVMELRDDKLRARLGLHEPRGGRARRRGSDPLAGRRLAQDPIDHAPR